MGRIMKNLASHIDFVKIETDQVFALEDATAAFIESLHVSESLP